MSDALIRELKDIEDIKKLKILYSQCLDMRDLDRLLGLFTDDAVCDFGRGRWQGHSALREGFAAAHDQFDIQRAGSYPFLHATTNHWVEITGPHSAQGRCYLIDFVTGEAEKNPLLLLGLYAEEYRRVDGRWLIHRSRIDFVWPSRDVGGGAPDAEMVLPA